MTGLFSTTTANTTKKFLFALLAALAFSTLWFPQAKRMETSVAGSQAGVIAITPVRVYDSRPGRTPGGNGPFHMNQEYSLPILGQGAVPASGVSAIMANLTVVTSLTSGGGYVTIWPDGQTKPTASNINFKPDMTIANHFLVPVGSNGAIRIFSSAEEVNVIIDIQGWVPTTTLTAVGPVVPFNTNPLISIEGTKARMVLTSATKYEMNTWWAGPAQTLLSTPLIYSTQTNNGDAIRRLGMAALSSSTAIATGAYDEIAVGVSRPIALSRTIMMIDYVAGAHFTNTTGGWGEGWQTPMWAGVIGRAAWYIWDQLPGSTQARVANMIEHEATYGASRKIKYMRNAAGTLLSSGDSGAEEVAWTMSAAQVAAVMLPFHPQWNIWMSFIVRSSLAAWARPIDATNASLINGQSINKWINGSNVEPDGTVINHSRIASDYSTTFYDNLNAAPLFALANESTPIAVSQFLAPVYDAFTTVSFGGQYTYVPNTGDIYYPQGNDWGTGQKLPYALADALALTYGLSTFGTAQQYLNLHLDAQLAMQARFTDGHTYLNNAEYNYVGKEEHTMQLASQLYLALYMWEHNLYLSNNDSFWIG